MMPSDEITLSRILVNFGRTDEIFDSNKEGTCINMLLVNIKGTDWRVGTAFPAMKKVLGFEGGICETEPVNFEFENIRLPTMTNAFVINFYNRDLKNIAPFGYTMAHELFHNMAIEV